MTRFARLGGYGAVWLLAILTIAPIGLVLLRSVLTPSGVTLEHYRAAFTEPANIQAGINTVIVSVATVIFATLVAIPLAWLVSRTDIPGARRFRVLLLVPYVVPPYIGAIAWINLANPTVGWLNRAAGAAVFDIYSMTGVIWVTGLFFYTYVYVACLAALERVDPSLEDAARVSGAGPLMVLRTITLPLIRPAILAGAFLVFAASAAAFGVPALIASPARPLGARSATMAKAATKKNASATPRTRRRPMRTARFGAIAWAAMASPLSSAPPTSRARRPRRSASRPA